MVNLQDLTLCVKVDGMINTTLLLLQMAMGTLGYLLFTYFFYFYLLVYLLVLLLHTFLPTFERTVE